MLKYTVVIAINASPDVVFEVLTDAPSWPEWNTTVDSLEGTIALGEEVTLTSSFNVEGDEAMSFDLTVDELTPNESMTWTSGNFIFNGVRTFTVTDNGDGTSTLTMEENFSGLFSKSIAKSFDLQPSFDQMASDVKAEAESRMPVPEPEPEEEEVDVPLEELPEAVLNAVMERWPDAELKEAELEGEVYDVVFLTGEGELLEAEVAADGTIGEVEVEEGDDEDQDDGPDDGNE